MRGVVNEGFYCNSFWSEIKNINNCKTALPTSIEGISGGVRIVEFWRTHFSKLLNCVSVIVVCTLVNIAVIRHMRNLLFLLKR